MPKYTYSVILQKTDAKSLGDTIRFPNLKISKQLSVADRQLIEEHGLSKFAQSRIVRILNQKEASGEYFEMPKDVDKILEEYLKAQKDFKLGPHDIKTTVDIHYQRKNKCCCNRCCKNGFFGTILKPLTQLSRFAEISASTILIIGSLELTEGSMIPAMDAATSERLSISQAVMSALLRLWLSFSGPSIKFMNDFGAMLDDTIIMLCRKLCCSETAVATIDDEKPTTGTLAKIRIVQFIFAALALQMLASDAVGDYQQQMSYTNSLMGTSLPNWLYTTAGWVEFGFNQLNDPIDFAALIIMAFKMIYSHYAFPVKEEALLDDDLEAGYDPIPESVADEKSNPPLAQPIVISATAAKALERDSLLGSSPVPDVILPVGPTESSINAPLLKPPTG